MLILLRIPDSYQDLHASIWQEEVPEYEGAYLSALFRLEKDV